MKLNNGRNGVVAREIDMKFTSRCLTSELIALLLFNRNIQWIRFMMRITKIKGFADEKARKGRFVASRGGICANYTP